MSFYDDSTLMFLAAGAVGKDGKASTIKPVGGAAPLLVTRGSNLTATRIDSNGLIEKGRENLLLQSNQFNTTWTLNSTSVTSGQSGYDGSSDAWLLNSTTTGFPRIEQNVTSSGVATYSVYAKAATDGFILMRTFGADSQVWFNLNNGTVTNASGSQYITSNIQSVGNGWYRCSVTFNGSLTTARIYPASAYGTYSTSGNGVYIQDAQLELGLVATEYIESGATTGKAGLLENEPRFNYPIGGGSPHLLLEPQRTNSYIYHSEYITSSLANISREISNVDSPIKDTPFLKITKTGTGISRFPFTSFSTNGDFDTCSVFAKAGSSNILLFADSYNGLSTINAKFNLTNGDWDETPSGSALYDYGFEDFGNGMYRVWVCGQTYNTDTPEITARWRTPAVYCDIDQLPLGKYIYITGMQTEKNAKYPTSYIPNHSGGSVSRENETYQNTDIDTVTNMSTDECTIFLDVDLPQGREGSALFLQFTDFAGGGGTLFGLKGNYVPSPIIQIYGAGTLNTSNTHSLSVGRHKIAIRWLSGTATVFIDGAEVSALSITDSSAPTSFDQVLGRGEGYRHLVHQLIVLTSGWDDLDCRVLTGFTDYYASFSAMATALNYTIYE